MRTEVTNEQKEIKLLRIIAAMSGGIVREGAYRWLDWVCSDEVRDWHSDTFDRCIEKGWLAPSHNTNFETSPVCLTLAGRAILANDGSNRMTNSEISDDLTERQQS